MKYTPQKPLLVIFTCLSILACCQIYAQSTNQAKGNLSFDKAPIKSVLDIYRSVTGLELFIASNVHQATNRITLRLGGSPDTCPPIIEQVLLKQAGVVITHLDDKHASVTYNDQLIL